MDSEKQMSRKMETLSGQKFLDYLELEGIPDYLAKCLISNALNSQLLLDLTEDDIAALCPLAGDRLRIRKLQHKIRAINMSVGLPSLTNDPCISALPTTDCNVFDPPISALTDPSTSALPATTKPRLVCPICPYQDTAVFNMKLKHYLDHIKECHGFSSNFSIKCGMYGCPLTFKKYSTFRTHVYEYHGSDPMVTNQPDFYKGKREEEVGEEEMIIDMEDERNHDTSIIEMEASNDHNIESTKDRASAMFVLGIKERYKLTQIATQGVIDGATALMQTYLESLQREIQSRLPEQAKELDDLFSESSPYMDPFSSVKTPRLQLSYYRKHFNLIKPKRIVLGDRMIWKGGSKRKLVKKNDEMMYIPILETLQDLLKCDYIVDEIRKGHTTAQHSPITDFCDGLQYKKHPLFQKHNDSLQIFLYFDDLEVCNPLGSKRKIHKLSMFYFTLGNTHPKNRSKLSAIYLVSIVKHAVLHKYGIDTILKPFVEDMKKLEDGYMFTIRKEQVKVYGALAVISADNLGSLALGGFKESCSATRMCRYCMATQATAKTKFRESNFTLRSASEHQKHCKELLSNPNASKLYGINRDSALNTLKYSHVCDGSLVPDIMHDLLEGALQYEVKLMLKAMINEDHLFTLEIFNSRLASTEFGYMEEKDRPTPISASTLSSSGHSLSQSASQMWLLGRLLPLLIGDMVPESDPKWTNYLLMMKIVDVLFAQATTEDLVVNMAWQIEEHHREFIKLYPTESIIPKMHFMVHMPRLVLQFGPLIRYWTMRYEAKHSYYKSLTQALGKLCIAKYPTDMGNFVNLPYSLAMRHQQHQCLTRIDSSYREDKVTGPVWQVPSDTVPSFDGSATPSVVFE